MIDIEMVTQFLGWCTLINIVFLSVTSIAIVMWRKWISGYHGRLFGIDESKLSELYFGYLGQYKVITVALFLVPYLALKVMA